MELGPNILLRPAGALAHGAARLGRSALEIIDTYDHIHTEKIQREDLDSRAVIDEQIQNLSERTAINPNIT